MYIKDNREGAEGALNIDRDFLAKIIPNDGVFAVFWANRQNDKKGQVLCATLDEMVDTLTERCARGCDAYFGCASFKTGKSRTADNAKSMNALFLDLDCSEGKAAKGVGYATEVEALVALKAFYNYLGLPRPMVIESGGGIHAYWPFEEPVAVAEWIPVARRLKALCEVRGLLADPAVTADAARVLRPVGSVNFKYEVPQLVTLVEDNGPYKFETLAELIARAHDDAGADGDRALKEVGGLAVVPPGLWAPSLSEEQKVAPWYQCAMRQMQRMIHQMDEAEALYRQLDAWDETTENIAIVEDALAHIPADLAESDWKRVIWSVASLGWSCGDRLLIDWSRQSHKHWEDSEDNGVEALKELRSAYHRFDPGRSSTTTIRTLFYHARQHGYVGAVTFDGMIDEDRHAGEVGADSADVPIWVAKLNEKYAYVEAQKNIYRFDFGDFIKPSELKVQYQNAKLEISDQGKVSRVCRITAWLSHPCRRGHRGLVFSPSEGAITRNNDINTWTGLAVSARAGDVAPYIELRDYLFPNPDEARYVEQWLAHKLQQPGIKMNTALLVWSEKQGIGKNLFFETVGMIIGNKHYCLVTKDTLTGDFNSWAKDRIFVIGDEVLSGSDRASADKFKTLITGTSLRINEKFQPEYQIDNHAAFVFLSNHEDAMHLAVEDRRFYVVDVSTDPKPQSFYDCFTAWRDDGGLAALHYHLAHCVSMEGFNPKARAPETSAKSNMIAAGRSSLEQWMVDAFEDPRAMFGGEVISIDKLQSTYRRRTGDYACKTKAVENAAKKAGARRLDNQIRNGRGEKVRVWSVANHDDWADRPGPDWSVEYNRVEEHLCRFGG